MVSATCPNCHILLVEATSPTYTNLGTAVNRAVTLGAKYVSNSYGGSEFSTESSYRSHLGVGEIRFPDSKEAPYPYGTSEMWSMSRSFMLAALRVAPH
jgi:hypothetical protein